MFGSCIDLKRMLTLTDLYLGQELADIDLSKMLAGTGLC